MKDGGVEGERAEWAEELEEDSSAGSALEVEESGEREWVTAGTSAEYVKLKSPFPPSGEGREVSRKEKLLTLFDVAKPGRMAEMSTRSEDEGGG